MGSRTRARDMVTTRRHSAGSILAVVCLVDMRVAALGPTHGVVIGDVTDSHATVWSRSDANSTMLVTVYECDNRVVGEEFTGQLAVDSTSDYTGLVDFSGLTTETCYVAEVTFEDESSSASSSASSLPGSGTFNTAPRPEVTRAVRFAWSGDLAGQNICRDAEEGFPVMEALNAVEGKDFFMNVGDAIYGDGLCLATGLAGNDQVEGDFRRSSDLENYWAHWKYNLEEAGYQSLLSSQAFFMTWDDHEVVDDFGPDFDTKSEGSYTAGVHLLPIGLEAFLNYNPIRATVDPSEPLDFYRTVRWGKSLELFILDTRQYRSLPTANGTEDDPKTMLGATQLAWLKESLTNSTALWKMVVTSVPLSIPTGPSDEERDGWANNGGTTGYELELNDILTFMSESGMRNIVFLTADVHYAQAMRYQPFDSDTDFVFHEIVVGPLNAGLFTPADVDTTFSPEVLFSYHAERNSLRGLDTYEDTKEFFNFGLANIDLDGNLTFSIINTAGEAVHNLSLTPSDETASPAPTSILSSRPSPSGETVSGAPTSLSASSSSTGDGTSSPPPTSISTPSSSPGEFAGSPTTDGTVSGDSSGDCSVLTNDRVSLAGSILFGAAATLGLAFLMPPWFD